MPPLVKPPSRTMFWGLGQSPSQTTYSMGKIFSQVYLKYLCHNADILCSGQITYFCVGVENMLRLVVVGILMLLSGCATSGVAVNNIHISYSQGEHTISTSMSFGQHIR